MLLYILSDPRLGDSCLTKVLNMPAYYGANVAMFYEISQSTQSGAFGIIMDFFKNSVAVLSSYKIST